MIEKPEDRQIVKENCISMVQCKTIKQLELIEQKKFDDEDIQSDIEYLKEKMEASLQDLRLAIQITFRSQMTVSNLKFENQTN